MLQYEQLLDWLTTHYMHPFLQNKYIRFGLIALSLLVVLLVALAAAFSLLTSSTGHSESTYAPSSYAPASDAALDREVAPNTKTASFVPEPTAGEYTGALEAYETTSYRIAAVTKDFDELCASLTTLKASADIHFEDLTTTTNHCHATFYAEAPDVPGVLETLQQFRGVEVTRNTKSITRHRQQLQSQTDILQQQLMSVERSLATAESQYDDIATFARENNDAATLSQAITEKLRIIDQLTQRKINLTNSLDRLYQQSADLEKRLDVTQFTVQATRLNPIHPNETARQWEQAWEELQDTFTSTLIGLTAVFGVFLLWTVRIALYLLVALVFVRGLWKFAQLLWRKW